MAVQDRVDQKNFPFILSGQSLSKDNETILQDAGRATPLARFTVMARIAASLKWVPLTDVTAVDGTAIARGIYLGDDIAAADLVAGDVVGAPILVGGGCTVDTQQLVLENSVTLADVVVAAVAAVGTHVVEDDLAAFGIFVESTLDIDELEN